MQILVVYLHINCNGGQTPEINISDYYSMGECAAEPRGNGNGKNL